MRLRGHYAESEAGGAFLVLCHHPFRSGNRQHRRATNLRGHSHGRLKPQRRQFDVGVDARDFRPLHLEDILESLRSRGNELSWRLDPGPNARSLFWSCARVC